MSIDTKQKKLSVLNAGNPWPGPLFEPDGTIDTGDKQHVLNLYSGITAAEDVALFPGDATVSRKGPGATTVSRKGPGSTIVSRKGPGAVTASRKTS